MAPIKHDCEPLKYMSGFGDEFASEDPRCPGSLPVGLVCRWDDLLQIIAVNLIRITHKSARTICSRSNCLAARSPVRDTRTSAPGCTAFVHPLCIVPSRRSSINISPMTSANVRPIPIRYHYFISYKLSHLQLRWKPYPMPDAGSNVDFIDVCCIINLPVSILCRVFIL